MLIFAFIHRYSLIFFHSINHLGSGLRYYYLRDSYGLAKNGLVSSEKRPDKKWEKKRPDKKREEFPDLILISMLQILFRSLLVARSNPLILISMF